MMTATNERRRFLLVLASAVVPLLAMSGCFFTLDRAGEVQVGEVAGRVVDASGQPIAFAKVSVENTPLSARSTSDGRFVVKGMTEGVYLLNVVVDADANGFPSAGALVAFSLPPDTGLLLGDVTVQSTTTLTGSVAFEDGTAAPGSRVSVFREVELDGVTYDGPIEAEVIADTAGEFVVPGVVAGAFRIFAEGLTVGAAQTLSTETPDNLRLILPNVVGNQISPQVVLVVNPSPRSDARIFLRQNLSGAAQELTRAFAAGEALLDGLNAGRYDVRVCTRGDACDVADETDAVAFAMPLPPTGAQYRWGPLSFSTCTDCDSDGVDRFLSIDPRTVEVCGETCANVYADPSATCAFDGEQRDCDDDGDGQPDIFEPAGCRLAGQGGDRDNDGVCDRDDLFPDCPANVDVVCNAPGAFPVGEGILPGQGPVAPVLIDECALEIAGCDPNATCTDLEEGFVCACDAGFEGDGFACADIDECLDADTCTGGTCSNTAGGFACACNAGYSANAEQTLCTDIDECADPNICGAGGVCTNEAGSFRCECETGFELDAETNLCVDVDECASDPQFCGPTGRCQNTPGSFLCSCDSGYVVGAGGTCENEDECSVTPGICGAGTCTDEVGSYACECDAGYAFDGSTCEDLDECTLTPEVCGPGGTCTNIAGAFTCACDAGYTVGAGGGCENVDECAVTPDICGEGSCTDLIGAYACSCDSGFTFDGVTCADVDECEDVQNPVCGSATCSNLLGGFECTCPSGFDFDVDQCVDINECDEDPCAATVELCVNEEGSFRCDCAPGYADDGGGNCIDIDECVETPGVCDVHASCTNEVGSFQCDCLRGWTGDGVTCAVDNVMALCTPAALPSETFGNEQFSFDFSGEANDRFGRAVAISDDGLYVLAGAPNVRDVTPRTGAVYLYENTGSFWSLLGKIVPGDAVDNDDLGFGLAINGDGTRFAFGAPGNDAAGSRSGTVWVYSRSGSTVTFEQRLTASNATVDAFFGETLAMSANGDVLAIGASGANVNGDPSGSVYLYSYSGTAYGNESILSAGTSVVAGFGEDIALDALGDTLIVGARNELSNAGAAYAYSRNGPLWDFAGELLSPEPLAGTLFGDSVSVSPDGLTIVVAASRDATHVTRGGAAYVYENVTGVWTYVQKIRTNAPVASDFFGTSIAMGTGGVPLVVGAPNDENVATASGKAVVFAIENGAYCEQQTLAGGTGEEFGYAVDVSPSGADLAVGARFAFGKSEPAGGVSHFNTDP